jgi:hypothetical protein
MVWPLSLGRQQGRTAFKRMLRKPYGMLEINKPLPLAECWFFAKRIKIGVSIH